MSAPAVSPSEIAPSLAARLLEHIGRGEHAVGERLTEHALAVAMGVSRTPVRRALRYLEGLGAVGSSPNRGFFVAIPSDALRGVALPAPASSDEEVYMRIAEDRLSGELPDAVSEAQLMERYELTRLQVQRALNRMAREGLAERKSGRGWRFRPLLNTVEAHRESYRFRMSIEPAALLEPTFRIDAAAFARCRREQLQMLDGGIERWSSSERFRAGAEFHETIVACSGNRFFSDALRNVNRLRRLIEYRQQTSSRRDLARLHRQCVEHLQLLDMIESGSLVAASRMLREHLDVVGTMKTGAADAPGERVGSKAAAPIEVHL
jgi:DNA-binding GntR family transcriptional regulator